ncbi:hypothetical protein EMGBS8_18040, partial [Verrucomicrobiota bacterium]
MGRTVAVFDWTGSSSTPPSPMNALGAARCRRETHLPADHFVRGFGKRNELIIPDILSGRVTRRRFVASLTARK